MPPTPTHRRRREDTWEIDDPSNSDPPPSAVDRLAEQNVRQAASEPPTHGSGSWSWNGIPSSDAPSDALITRHTSPLTSQQALLLAHPSQPLPASQSRSHSQTLFGNMLSSERETRHISGDLLDNLGSSLQRSELENPRNSSFPYKARPIPRTIEEAWIPERSELAVLERIHGKPRPMRDDMLYRFADQCKVPLDLAYDMSASSLIGQYPSGLVYLNHQRLAMLPAQRHREYALPIPALYWARTLSGNQESQRQHIEHRLSRTSEPCTCPECELYGSGGHFEGDIGEPCTCTNRDCECYRPGGNFERDMDLPGR